MFVHEAFLELLEEVRPALNVRYSVMNSVTRNSSALQIFMVSGQSGERQVCHWDFKKLCNNAHKTWSIYHNKMIFACVLLCTVSQI